MAVSPWPGELPDEAVDYVARHVSPMIKYATVIRAAIFTSTWSTVATVPEARKTPAARSTSRAESASPSNPQVHTMINNLGTTAG